MRRAWRGSDGAARSRRCGSTRAGRSSRFDGVETMNDAEALAGAELKVPESDAGAAARASTYYRHDLVGCEVRDEGRAGRSGKVTAVDGPLERSRLVIARPARGSDGADGRRSICVSVDPAAKMIVDRSAGRIAGFVKFDIVTIFPKMVEGPLAEGIVARAIANGLLDVRVHDLRDLHDRPAPRRGRHAVRRRARDGAEAGTAVCGGRGDRASERRDGARRSRDCRRSLARRMAIC